MEKPSLLSRFFIFSFGVISNFVSYAEYEFIFFIFQFENLLVFIFQDLKAFNYYYYFAYPCPSTPIFEKIAESNHIVNVFNPEHLDAFTKLYIPLSSEQRSFFILTQNDADNFNYFKLSDKISATNRDENFADANIDKIYFCFSDPCPTVEYGGWPLRLFLLMLTHLWYVFWNAYSFIYTK